MIRKLTMVLLAIGIFASLGFVVSNPFSQDVEAEEKKAYLGVYLSEVSRKIAEKYELAESKGAYITSVMPGTAADDAGLKRGDIVISVDGKDVNSPEDLAELIKSHKPGDVISVKLFRKGREQTLTVELGERHARTWSVYSGHKPYHVLRQQLAKSPKVVIRKPGKIDSYVSTFLTSRYFLGINYQNMNEQLGEYFGITDGKGVLITEVEDDSPAQKAGLKAGDVILRLAGDDVENSHDLLKALVMDSEEETETVEIVVLRNKKEVTLSVDLEKKGKAIHVAPRLYMDALKGWETHLEGLEEHMKDFELHIDDFDFHIDEGDFFIRGLDHVPVIVDEFVDGFNIIIDKNLDGFNFHMTVNPDGKVEFNDKKFDSMKEFKEYLKSDEHKEWKEKHRKEWNEKRKKINPIALSL